MIIKLKYFSLALLLILCICCTKKPQYDPIDNIDPKPIPTTANCNILVFQLNGEYATISDSLVLVRSNVNDLSNLTPSKVGISEGATISPLPNSARDFTNPVYYTVTSSTGKTKKYMVVVLKNEGPLPLPTKELPILGWWGIPENRTSLAAFQTFKESGMNTMLTFYGSLSALQNALDYAQQVGVKIIASCPELNNSNNPDAITKIVNLIKDHPALGGYWLCDEPSIDNVGSMGSPSVREKIISAADPDHFCYMNLFPLLSTGDSRLGKPENKYTYSQYVDSAMHYFKTNIISFDNYPISDNGTKFIADIPNFYNNLEIISQKASASGRSFWAFALSIVPKDSKIPLISHLRFQMYNNLAYGAKGLEYFTYYSTAPAYIAPVNLDDKLTDIYMVVKQMNTELNALSYVFVGSKVNWVKHSGKAIDNLQTTPLYASNLPPAIQKLDFTGDAVVSYIENGVNQYLFIVNRSFEEVLNVNIKVAPNVKRVMKDRSIYSAFYEPSVEVTPGDAIIYMWTK